MFYVGQEVVCIDTKDHWRYATAKIPEKGNIYTIRGFDDCEGLYLEEVVNEKALCYNHLGKVAVDEPSFWITNFRPIQKKKADISVFTDLLIPIKQEELV